MRNGFTILELIVSVAVIIMLSIALFALSNAAFSAGGKATVWKPGCIAHNFRESTSHPGIGYCTNCLKTARIEFSADVAAGQGKE